MRKAYLRQRRVIAVAALLLASSLEICGCDLARNLEPRCAICPASDEIAKLVQIVSAARVPSRSSEAPGTAALEGQQLAFYEPVGLAATVGDNSSGRPLVPLLAGARADSAPFANSSSLSAVFSRFTPPSGSEPQPWPIPESVFFIYTHANADHVAAHRVPSATAFVVSVPHLDHLGRVRFLVTARHVVDPEWAHCRDRNPTAMDVRFNRSSGGSAFEHILLESHHVRQFLTLADATVDIAVIPIDETVVPNIEAYKFMDTPFRLLPTTSEVAAIRRDQPEDDAVPAHRRIVTAITRTHVVSEDRDYPVSGAGMLKSTWAAPVEIRCGTDSGSTTLKLWTINAAVPPEVSGAPVYTTMKRGSEHTESPVLLGVQSIAWPGRPVAGITPADALGELIQEALGRRSKEMDLYKGPLR